MIPSILAGLAVIFALGAVVLAYVAARNAQLSAQYCQENNKRTKLTRFEAELTGLVDDVSAIRESMHKLRSRIGMRELRERKKSADSPVEFDASPAGRDAERAALEKELAESGRLTPRIHNLQGIK